MWQKKLVNAVQEEHGEGVAHSLPKAKILPSGSAYMARAKAHLCHGRFVEAAVDYSRGGQISQVEELASAWPVWIEVIRFLQEENFEAAEDALVLVERAGPTLLRSAAVLVERAKASFRQGKWSSVQRSCGRILQDTTCHPHGIWKDERDPVVSCVRMGARAALELGDVEKAKKTYGVALRNDPEAPFKNDMKRLQKLSKHMKNAKKQMDKSYNHKALEAVAEAAAIIEGELHLISHRLQAETSLLTCKLKAKIKHHEAAIDKCEEALEYYMEIVPGLVTSPMKLVEVRETLAEAHTKDNNFDEAVKEFRAALTQLEDVGADANLRIEMTRKWRRAQQQEKAWEERRDHLKVLDMPSNIDRLSTENKCNWLKKQHRKMVTKWHPDKAKSEKRGRAERKFNEVAEANKVLKARWDCKTVGKQFSGRR